MINVIIQYLWNYWTINMNIWKSSYFLISHSWVSIQKYIYYFNIEKFVYFEVTYFTFPAHFSYTSELHIQKIIAKLKIGEY